MSAGITSVRATRLSPHYLAVWRAVADIGQPAMVSEIARHPLAEAAIREVHLRLANVLSHLHKGGYIAFKPGEVRRTGTYWFGQNCTVPTGVAAPEPFVEQIDTRAARRLVPYDRTPAVDSLEHQLQMRQIARDRAEIPSRRGNYLVYRDGRRVHVDREFNPSAWGDL